MLLRTDLWLPEKLNTLIGTFYHQSRGTGRLCLYVKRDLIEIKLYTFTKAKKGSSILRYTSDKYPLLGRKQFV